jgi:hypothetical protein
MFTAFFVLAQISEVCREFNIFKYLKIFNMLKDFEFYLFLVFLITMLIMLANKIKVAYPVLLVLAGLLISFIPGCRPLK